MGQQTYSLERSFIQTRLTNAELLSYLNVTITDDLGSKVKDVKVFTDMEYNFTFYDASSGSRRSLTGLVLDVFEDQIKIKTILKTNNSNKPNCNTCKKRHNCKDYHDFKKANQPPMPTCNCVLNPPDTSKYSETEIIFIPLANLIDVSYILSDNGQMKKPKGGTKVLLLGISATMVKAIVIHLEFFDDNIENAVKYVNLEKDGIYDIAYMSKNGTIFEVRAKIAGIEELPHPDNSSNYKPAVVRENVGGKNSVYAGYEDDCCTTKHDFMEQPPAPPVKIIMDTSDTFEGRYESIMLDQIRECSTVYSPSENGEGVIVDPSESRCCDCCDKNQKFEYKYEDGSKATIDGDNVSLMVNGSKTDLTLEDLVKFYLGIG